jgi:hypothetical protein
VGVGVDGVGPAPDVGVVGLELARSAADPGVGEEDADVAELRGVLAGAGPVGLLGDVELQADGVGAVRAQFGGGGLRAGALDVGQDRPGAAPRQGAGGLEPDAAGASGDEGGLALQVLHAAASLRAASASRPTARATPR